jgi:hypothetical protein
MAGFLHLEKLNASINFNPPSKFLNPLESPIEQVAENLRAIEDYCARTSIPTSLARGDQHTITSLAPVNTIVSTCNVLILSVAIQTQFQDPPNEVQAENTEVQVENSTDSRRVPSYLEYLLTRPGLDSLGLESAYLPATNADDTTYTICGTPFVGLTSAQKRHISAVFTWDSDLLYRMNQHVLTAYHLAFDLSSINDLDPTLFAFHVSCCFAFQSCADCQV